MDWPKDKRIVKVFLEAGADIVLTECNSCAHNLSNAKRSRHTFKISTIANFVNDLLDHVANSDIVQNSMG